MGKTKSQQLLTFLKEILEYLSKHQIMVTAEYLPRSTKSSGKPGIKEPERFPGVECPQVFKKNCHKMGQPEIDVFASRLSN